MPQLLEGVWKRIHRTNTMIEVVPQMLISVQVWGIRGPGSLGHALPTNVSRVTCCLVREDR